MFVIMGATGHVGSAVTKSLLGQGQPVTIVTHEASRGEALQAKGAEMAVADVNDVAALRKAFRRGKRAFLLNPPADVKSDTYAVERASVAGILAALEGSGLEKIVAESTAGAQPGERIGDLSVLWELEEGLRAQPIPAAINRAAYYMSNWDDLLDPLRETGTLPTMYPADLKLPMVAPADLGRVAAERLLSDTGDIGVRYVEGPERYSSEEIAAAFSRALGKPVEVEVIPREQYSDVYRKLGFSEAAADSYARMTEVSLDQGFDKADDAVRGEISLEGYIGDLVNRAR